jgi:hypothetical protein
VPAISIGEAMDTHEAVFKTQGDFIRSTGLVFMPEQGIIQQFL